MKLFHYGFDNSALNLIAYYFADRFQGVKFNRKLSSLMSIKLGVPQGSVLGPLFFLLMINNLYTLYNAEQDLNILINRFLAKIKPLVDWCFFNKLGLNWSKTYFMFVTNRRVKLLSEISVKKIINNKTVEVSVKICLF